jgi:hypothetical protein
MTARLPFREVWAVDFEFIAPPGERPKPLCVVARELRSGRVVRQWLDGVPVPPCPYPTGPDSLFVAYFASAEMGCQLALGWPTPERVLDLYAEFKNVTNGCPPLCGHGLLGALVHHDLPGIAAGEKDSMRDLAMRGGPYTADEQTQLMDYCESDVTALANLLPAMLPRIDLYRALLRGRYMTAVARMEWVGVPIDTDWLTRLRGGWNGIRTELVAAVDARYGAFVVRDGVPSFNSERWEAYLARAGIPWPRQESGRLALDDETFKEMEKRYPNEIGPMRDLRTSLSGLKLNDLAVGSDGRNRCLLSPFASKTGRNQPSNSKFIYGPATWLRSLIRPQRGMALAYIDWSQQELAIAAALSGDGKMMAAYRSGDFYLTFARMAGAVPADATKQSHEAEREQYKTVSLGVLYGLSEYGLANKLGLPVCHGRQLLEMHKQTFRDFWRWSDDVETQAMLGGRLRTAFGWGIVAGAEANPRSLRNFPVQGNGAEMMRLAAILATERGIRVCCPVHDAFLIEGPEDLIDAEVARMQDAMREASELVLPGFPLKSEAKVVRHPDRYTDPRGAGMWETVTGILDRPDTK